MAHLLASRVAETSTTTGTGTFSLGGEIPGHRTFASALSASDTTEYVIAADDGTWEVGVGTYSASTLARTTVVASSNGNALVNFASGSKIVAITPLATTLMGRFEGTARRITADFDNGTIGNRTFFQTTTTNGVTDIGVIPNGTGAESYLTLNNASNPANAGRLQLYIKSTEAALEANKLGTGSYLPVGFWTGGVKRASFGASGGFDLFTGMRQARVAMGANAVDLAAGNYFTKTFTATTFGLTVQNVPAAGTVASFIMDITNAGLATITWFSNTKWAGGTAPALTSSGRDIVGFFSHDNGANWNGLLLARDIK